MNITDEQFLDMNKSIEGKNYKDEEAATHLTGATITKQYPIPHLLGILITGAGRIDTGHIAT